MVLGNQKKFFSGWGGIYLESFFIQLKDSVIANLSLTLLYDYMGPGKVYMVWRGLFKA